MRILARAWLYVIWECWHNRIACDPAQHRALQRLLAAQDTGADQARMTANNLYFRPDQTQSLTQGYSYILVHRRRSACATGG